MNCLLCGRPLTAAAVFLAGYPIGPVCGKRAGLLKLAARGKNRALRMGPAGRVVRSKDDGQLALELEVVA